MARLVEATAEHQVASVRELFREYARLVDEPCCFVDFEREVAGLPGPYQLFLLDDATGCVALRVLDPQTAEMKRLYVRSGQRGKGHGRALAEAAIGAARKAGCTRIVLDTLPKMQEALALYRTLRFEPIQPYLENPTPGALCFELKL